MPIPIGDDNTGRRTTPIVNYLLIVLNIYVFIHWQGWGENIPVTYAYATVPGEILSGSDIVTNSQVITDAYTGDQFELPGLQVTPIPIFLTLITSLFLHGGIAHLFGNMLFLWIFGDNIEDAMGHTKYLVFYILCGILAGLSHVFSTFLLGQNTLIPSLGASGAISGVLGAYILLHPGRGIHVWFYLFVATLPAFIVVGMWFLFQILNSLGTLGGQEAGGVAYAAHIGGFIAGLLICKLFIKHIPKNRNTGWVRRY